MFTELNLAKADIALEILEEIIQNVKVVYPSQDSLAILLELTQHYEPSGLKIHDFEIISIGLAAGYLRSRHI